MDPEHYRDVTLLGQGAFGSVHRATRVQDNVVVAVKEIDLNRVSAEFHSTFEREYQIGKSLIHKNILRYLALHQRGDNVLLIEMELCPDGSLDDMIKEASRGNELVAEDTIWETVVQLCDGLEYLHDNSNKSCGKIIHRDLKPDNIMYSGATLKIGDLGLARMIEKNSKMTVYVGTPQYMAPEVARGLEYDTFADIWSVGCIIYEMCCLRRPPWDAKTLEGDPSVDIPEEYSNDLKELIRNCLRFTPSSRIGLASISTNGRVHRARDRINKKTDDFLVAVREKNVKHINGNIDVLQLCAKEAVEIARRDKLFDVMQILVPQLYQKNILITLDPIETTQTDKPTALMTMVQNNKWKAPKAQEYKASLQKNYSVLLTLEDDNPGTPRYVLGTTALMVAAHYNNVEAVKNLLAEVGARDSQGFTALMYAARRGHTQAVSLLLIEAGATNNFGHTALMLAAWHGHKDCVKVLYELEEGISDHNGYKVISYAENPMPSIPSEVQKDIVEIISSHK